MKKHILIFIAVATPCMHMIAGDNTTVIRRSRTPETPELTLKHAPASITSKLAHGSLAVAAPTVAVSMGIAASRYIDDPELARPVMYGSFALAAGIGVAEYIWGQRKQQQTSHKISETEKHSMILRQINKNNRTTQNKEKRIQINTIITTLTRNQRALLTQKERDSSIKDGVLFDNHELTEKLNEYLNIVETKAIDNKHAKNTCGSRFPAALKKYLHEKDADDYTLEVDYKAFVNNLEESEIIGEFPDYYPTDSTEKEKEDLNALLTRIIQLRDQERAACLLQKNKLSDEQVHAIDTQIAVNRQAALDEIVTDHPGVCNQAKADVTKEWQKENSPSYHKATAFKWGGLLSTLSAAAIGVFSWFS